MPEFDQYFAAGGDEKFRYTYDLKPTDLVVDAGAYHGKWSKKIYDRYGCKILAFEPIYHEMARQTLLHTNAVINTVGLGERNETLEISVEGDRTSTYKNGGNKVQIKIRDFIEVMNEYKVDKIALLKINIEGGEFSLLEHLIRNNYVTKIAAIQVQFHDFILDAYARRQAIQDKLKQTHHLTYNFSFVWENWALTAS